MPLLTRKIRNSMAFRGALIASGLFVFAAALQGYFNYQNLESDLESSLGSHLEQVARTAADLIEIPDHDKIVQAYLSKDPNVTALPEFQDIQALLKKIKGSNQLAAELYTFVRPDWQKDKMVFITMDSDKPFIGNALPLVVEAQSTLDKGKAAHTHIRWERGGAWISAFAPLRDSDGRIAAGLGLEYRADHDYNLALQNLYWQESLPFALGILISALIGAIIGQTMGRRVRQLSMITVAASQGNLRIRSGAKLKGDLGILAANLDFLIGELEKSRNAEREYAEGLEASLVHKEGLLDEVTTATTIFLQDLPFFVFGFGADGKALSLFSRECFKTFGHSPENHPVWELLGGTEAEWNIAIRLLFDPAIPFDTAVHSCPRAIIGSHNLAIHLQYRPMFSGKKVVGIIVGGSPAAEASENSDSLGEQERWQALQSATLQRNYFAFFVSKTLKQIFDLKNKSEKNLALEPWHTLLNEIEEGAAILNLSSVLKTATRARQKFAGMRSAPSNVAQAMLPGILAVFEEIEIALNAVASEVTKMTQTGFQNSHEMRALSESELKRFAAQLPANSPWQREFSDQFLSRPLSEPMLPYGRLVQYLSKKQEKQLMPLEIHGGENRIRTEPLTALFDSLVHIFRNAITHGIETPQEREAAGKDPSGTIGVSFALTEANPDEPRWLSICIQDDGRGVDAFVIQTQLRKRGWAINSETKSEHEIIQYIFEEGVSTWADPDEASSHGRGLSHVRSLVESLGGVIEASSRAGQGTQIMILVPVPNAVVPESLVDQAA